MSDTDTLPRPTASACAFFGIRRASRTISRCYDRALRTSGLKISHFSLLSVVRDLGPIYLTGIAEVLALERTSLTRNPRPLENRGLIRVSPEGFRRARMVEITDEGLAVWRRARVMWQTAQDAIDAHLGAERAAELRLLLADVTGLDEESVGT